MYPSNFFITFAAAAVADTSVALYSSVGFRFVASVALASNGLLNVATYFYQSRRPLAALEPDASGFYAAGDYLVRIAGVEVYEVSPINFESLESLSARHMGSATSSGSNRSGLTERSSTLSVEEEREEAEVDAELNAKRKDLHVLRQSRRAARARDHREQVLESTRRTESSFVDRFLGLER